MLDSEKRKRWLEFVVFPLLLLPVLIFFSEMMNPIPKGRPDLVSERDAYVAAALTQPADSIGVAVLGDSEALVLLSPKMLWEEAGISSYIVAQSGQTPSEAYHALRDLVKTQSPKLVILETDLLVNDTNERRELIGMFNTAAYDVFPVLRYHGKWKEMLGLKEPEKIEHYRGFALRTDVVPYTGGEYMQPTEKKTKILRSSLMYLKRIRQICEEKGSELLLVSAPAPMNFNYAKHNAIRDYADRNGLTYLDLNEKTEELGIDWNKDMLDGGDHVNVNGTEKITRYLMEYLK
ncbi:MAG: SGNH/GDSL hydrolase family protein [Lachnospiraceae bacterium]|jgi:hypothetical protein|nr:SGNH/GDSL hydrolase family protein [Lachnospiraceae bacterium]